MQTQTDPQADPQADPKVRRRVGATARPRVATNSPIRDVAKTTRMGLALDPEAAKRLGDYAHVSGRLPGAIVSQLILAGVPRISFRQLDHFEPGGDTREDRQAETVA
jgi:hypothetical protein